MIVGAISRNCRIEAAQLQRVDRTACRQCPAIMLQVHDEVVYAEQVASTTADTQVMLRILFATFPTEVEAIRCLQIPKVLRQPFFFSLGTDKKCSLSMHPALSLADPLHIFKTKHHSVIPIATAPVIWTVQEPNKLAQLFLADGKATLTSVLRAIFQAEAAQINYETSVNCQAAIYGCASCRKREITFFKTISTEK